MSSIEKLIAYFGAENTGKTTTLNILIKLLNRHQDFETLLLDPSLLEENSDRYTIFKHLTSGKLIGVATTGDDAKTTQDNCENFKKDNINIGVTATRSHGGTTNALTTFMQENKIQKIWWIGASYPTTYEEPHFSTNKVYLAEYNNIMANTLFNAIEVEIKKS